MSLALFLLAESIFNLGLSVFFLLYNLRLLGLGFDEAFLGLSASLMTLGSLCGTLPAGWITARCGVRAALRVTFGAGAAVCACQAWSSDRTVLLVLSFLGGLAAAFRAVTIAPAVAQLTTEQNRARGFSWFFALGIGMGILGGLVGGRIPLHALWIPCAFAGLALVPTLWLRFAKGGLEERPRLVYPRSPFVVRYLAAAAVWSLVLGAFPSLYNAYFARRLSAAPSQIGVIFAVSQLVQVGGILLAPRLFALTGLGRGIVLSQVMAAAFLALLAPRWPLAAAGACYAAYMSFQYMSEPGWQTLLMNGVRPEERSGASSLNFLVMFSAQAVGAAVFGGAVARVGYAGPLLLTAVIGLAAAATTSQISRR